MTKFIYNKWTKYKIIKLYTGSRAGVVSLKLVSKTANLKQEKSKEWGDNMQKMKITIRRHDLCFSTRVLNRTSKFFFNSVEYLTMSCPLQTPVLFDSYIERIEMPHDHQNSRHNKHGNYTEARGISHLQLN